MKRFLLFGGDKYYPSGGWNDFIDSFVTKEEALKIAAERKFEWFHIKDIRPEEE